MTSLLPLVAVLVFWLLGMAAALLGFLIWRDRQAKRKEDIVSSIDDLMVNMNVEGWGSLYDVPPSRKQLANAAVIADHLEAMGLLDSRVGDRSYSLEEVGSYLARVRKYVSRHGVRRAKREKAAIFDEEFTDD